MMKFFKQSGPSAQIVVFLAILAVCCLSAFSILGLTSYAKGLINNPFAALATATFTAPPLPQLAATQTPSPEVFFTLTPLPGQWTSTPTPLPDQATEIFTVTPVERTIAPTTNPNSPTPTQEFPLEDTPTPESNAVLRDVQLKYIQFQADLKAFKALNSQLDSDHTLLLNETWKASVLTALANLEQSAIRLASVNFSDPNYAAYASYLDQLSSETGFMASAYRKALDKVDLVSMQVAIVHLQAMDDVILKAEQEYRAVKSRLATPAFTLEPSPSSTP